MRHRIPVIVVTILALIGLAAPAASAASRPHPLIAGAVPSDIVPISCASFLGVTYHIMSNDDSSVGIDYQGTGKLTKVTTSPGDSNLTCVNSSSDYTDIHNNAGNCIRMRDASNNYTMIEETGCISGDANYQFQAYLNTSNGLVLFQNIHFGKWLGVNCPVRNGKRVRGVHNAPGNCDSWILNST
jgi:hypothetical protein